MFSIGTNTDRQADRQRRIDIHTYIYTHTHIYIPSACPPRDAPIQDLGHPVLQERAILPSTLGGVLALRAVMVGVVGWLVVSWY